MSGKQKTAMSTNEIVCPVCGDAFRPPRAVARALAFSPGPHVFECEYCEAHYDVTAFSEYITFTSMEVKRDASDE